MKTSEKAYASDPWRTRVRLPERAIHRACAYVGDTVCRSMLDTWTSKRFLSFSPQSVLISVPDGQQIEQGMSCPLQARGDLDNITSNKATRPATR